MFAEPGTAIDGLHRDLLQLWDHYRSDDWNSRRIGILHLANDAYVQWIGYSRWLVVEVCCWSPPASLLRMRTSRTSGWWCKIALRPAGLRSPSSPC